MNNQIEKSPTDRTLILMRHGEKGLNGALTVNGIKEAEALGRRLRLMHPPLQSVCTSTRQRVIDTAAAVTRGFGADTPCHQTEVLSMSMVFLGPNGDFENRVDARLATAHASSEAEREDAVLTAERESMMEWLGKNDVPLDKCTKSPLEVADKIATFVHTQLRDAVSGTLSIDVTHEFHVAAFVQNYLIHGRQGVPFGRIDYLEGVEIMMNEAGNLRARFRNNIYRLSFFDVL
ncbi:MAG: histidine phosphatase family protein [Candidatus Gracilibacteria bacterium]